jgi:superfamily II DNA or RNA helicase
MKSIEAREWQKNALNFWSDSGKNGIVSVVTGGGKSIFACLCIEQIMQDDPDVQVLIVVPTITLQDQWLINLTEIFSIGPSDVSIWRSSKKPERRFNVCVINSLKNFTRFDQFFLVADECHRYGSDSFYTNLNGGWKYTLGLSATPDREYDDYLNTRLLTIFKRVIFSYSYKDAQRDGVINDFDLFNVFSSLLPSEESEYEELTRKIGVASRMENEEVVKLLKIKRNRVVIQSKNRLINSLPLLRECSGKQTIVFFETVKFAREFYEILKSINLPSVIYHSKQSNSARYQSLRLFRDGYYGVLIACRALDEGLDIPNIECAIIVSSSATKRQRIQRIGRSLRMYKDKGRSRIYTLYSSSHERDRLIQEIAELPMDVKVNWLKGK